MEMWYWTGGVGPVVVIRWSSFGSTWECGWFGYEVYSILMALDWFGMEVVRSGSVPNGQMWWGRRMNLCALSAE